MPHVLRVLKGARLKGRAELDLSTADIGVSPLTDTVGRCQRKPLTWLVNQTQFFLARLVARNGITWQWTIDQSVGSSDSCSVRSIR
ncbi:MAG: hypothetical protein CM1200mP9_03140 [Gammaproteobacteria bacterium]|nr:MAG: hypothetical protein CM1200mP9_03140 [Gammaproteobacteria bacterium]